MKINNVFFLIVTIFFIPSLHYAQMPCGDCHGEKDFTRIVRDGEEESLFVDEEKFQQSVHGGFECTDCHMDAEGEPHPEELEQVDCSICHEDSWDAFAEGIHGQLYLSGDHEAPNCVSCHGKHDILYSDNEESRTHPVNLPHTCGHCHKSNGVASQRDISISEPYEKFEKGVHGRALLDGNEAAASCNDCHNSHRLLPKNNPQSPIYITNISETCGECHESETEEYIQSIHGVSLMNGEFDSPTCTDCHGEHEILSPSDPTSPTFELNIAQNTCAPCHGLPRLNEKYGLLPDLVSSYENSYHGLASLRGSKVAANCTSCHGVHNIMTEENPNSTIHASNLTQTCGSCHVNASEAFAQSYIHAKPESLEDRIAAVIKDIYIWLIVLVIGGMVLHNLLIWLYYVRLKYRSMKKQETLQRFDKEWVFQHVTMFITFTILVITGFALKYPEATWVRILTQLGMSEAVRGITHRIAAVLMLVVGFYHIYCLFFRKSWKGEIPKLLPKLEDVKQFILNVKFHMGLTKQKPKFDRYGYVEKAEYWALVWGTAVMAITGFVLWFPTEATALFPAWIVKVSEVIHYYEAILATLAIALYHMFFAIFHPEDYPINLTGFTGKIPKEEAEERFPKWAEEIEEPKENKDF